jgi:hypothetical protein
VDYAENTTFQPVHWRAGHCQATAVSLFVSWSLPSNGSISLTIFSRGSVLMVITLQLLLLLRASASMDSKWVPFNADLIFGNKKVTQG